MKYKAIFIMFIMIIMILVCSMSNVFASNSTDATSIERSNIQGDLNNDSKVDSLDLRLMKEYILLAKATDIDLKNADINSDESIDSLDCTLLKKIILTQFEEIEAVTIKGFSSNFVQAMQIGVTENFNDDLLFIDSSGKVIALPDGYSIKVAAISGEGNVTTDAGSTTYSAVSLKNITFTGVAQGSTTFEISLIKDFDGSIVNKYAFTMEAVREDDITGYIISDISDKIYTGNLTSYGLDKEGNTDHDKTFTVKGLRVSTVVLVPGSVVKACSTNVGNITATTSGTIHVRNLIDTSSTDKEGRLIVFVADTNGVYNIEKKFVYSNATPVATTIKLLKESDDLEVTDGVYYISSKAAIDGVSVNDLSPSAAGKGVYFSVKDQYNTSINFVNTFFLVTNIKTADGNPTALVTADAKTGKITATTLNTGDSFIYSVLANGMVKSIKIAVQP